MMMAKVIYDDDDDSDDTSLPGQPFLFFNRRKSFGIPAAGDQTLAKATLHYDDDIIREMFFQVFFEILRLFLK